MLGRKTLGLHTQASANRDRCPVASEANAPDFGELLVNASCSVRIVAKRGTRLSIRRLAKTQLQPQRSCNLHAQFDLPKIARRPWFHAEFFVVEPVL